MESNLVYTHHLIQYAFSIVFDAHLKFDDPKTLTYGLRTKWNVNHLLSSWKRDDDADDYEIE